MWQQNPTNTNNNNNNTTTTTKPATTTTPLHHHYCSSHTISGTAGSRPSPTSSCASLPNTAWEASVCRSQSFRSVACLPLPEEMAVSICARPVRVPPSDESSCDWRLQFLLLLLLVQSTNMWLLSVSRQLPLYLSSQPAKP